MQRSEINHVRSSPSCGCSFLSPDHGERREAAFAKRLDSIDRRVQRLERDVGIAVEMIALFLRFWLASTPQLPEPAQAATRIKGSERYDQFLQTLSRRLAKGPSLLQEISDDGNS